MNEERVRVGVVGLGFMGSTHARNAEEFGHEVVAGVDVAEDARGEFAEMFDAATYGSATEMYGSEGLDAVTVSTPNAFHEEAVVPALEMGLDVFCEKPLAHTLESAERIAGAAREAEGFCAVNFHNRLSGAAAMLKEYQAEGRFGDVTHVEANYVRRRGIPGLGTWFTSRELAGGGALVDIGVHAIDFALYSLDYPEVESVFGVTRAEFGTREGYVDPDGWGDGTGGFEVEDSVTALVRCAGGQTISLEVSWAATREETDEFFVRGTDAGARLALGGDELTIYDTGSQGVDHYRECTHEGSLEPDGWRGSDKLFLDAVAEGTAPESNTVEEALTVQRVMEAIYRSSETGDAVGL
ncbi:Gfo/Idh/MocA family protein [Natronorarus salvus]|uniref:Gfo/Idh/MocA family protein n=1 Tax=Natronorarus salvus TaxID=3117733 RepID=UPI002F26A3CE